MPSWPKQTTSPAKTFHIKPELFIIWALCLFVFFLQILTVILKKFYRLPPAVSVRNAPLKVIGTNRIKFNFLPDYLSSPGR